MGIFWSKNGRLATPSAGGVVGSANFSYLVHTYTHTYIGGAPLSPHVHTQEMGNTPPLLSLPHMGIYLSERPQKVGILAKICLLSKISDIFHVPSRKNRQTKKRQNGGSAFCIPVSTFRQPMKIQFIKSVLYRGIC